MRNTLFTSFLMVLICAATASAGVYEISIEQPGLLASPAAEQAWIEDTLGLEFDLLYLAKFGSEGETEGSYVSSFDVDFNGALGEVSWDLALTGYGLDYILLKGANYYALYGVYEDQRYNSLGYESVELGFDNAISHISFYGTPGTSVPEPSLVLLLGLGLGAVSLTSRFSKKS